MDLLRRCIRSHADDGERYYSSDGIMFGSPLLGVQHAGMTISPGAAWSMACVSSLPQPDADQALRDAQYDEYQKVFNVWNGGMYIKAKSYPTSFFMEGMK